MLILIQFLIGIEPSVRLLLEHFVCGIVVLWTCGIVDLWVCGFEVGKGSVRGPVVVIPSILSLLHSLPLYAEKKGLEILVVGWRL